MTIESIADALLWVQRETNQIAYHRAKIEENGRTVYSETAIRNSHKRRQNPLLWIWMELGKPADVPVNESDEALIAAWLEGALATYSEEIKAYKRRKMARRRV